MNKIKITRAGGYDPKLGPKHPDNQDPTLDEPNVVSKFGKDNSLTRRIRMEGGDGGCITITERDHDDNLVEIQSAKGFSTTVELDAERLWDMAVAIISLFGGAVLTYDQRNTSKKELRDKIRDILREHESRCLDDDIDREVVIDVLSKSLGSP